MNTSTSTQATKHLCKADQSFSSWFHVTFYLVLYITFHISIHQTGSLMQLIYCTTTKVCYKIFEEPTESELKMKRADDDAVSWVEDDDDAALELTSYSWVSPLCLAVQVQHKCIETMKIKLLQTKVYVNNRRRRRTRWVEKEKTDRQTDRQMRLEVSQPGRTWQTGKSILKMLTSESICLMGPHVAQDRPKPNSDWDVGVLASNPLDYKSVCVCVCGASVGAVACGCLCPGQQ